MTPKEFVERVEALNLLAETEKVQDVAKELFPKCETMQMGYGGGYSLVIKNTDATLRDYQGKVVTKNISDGYFEDVLNNDDAFGTIQIEWDNDDAQYGYQIYHKGIGLWQVDITDLSGYNTDNEELGSYENAIQYLINLKKKIK